MADPMQVEVVSADKVVWSGTSTNVIAKTTNAAADLSSGISAASANDQEIDSS